MIRHLLILSVIAVGIVGIAGGSIRGAQQEPPIDHAKRVIDLLDAGKFEEVAAEFNAKMAAAMPVSRLRDTWTAISRQLGARTSILLQRVIPQATGNVTVVTACQFDKAALNVMLSFDAANKIAGMNITRAHLQRMRAGRRLRRARSRKNRRRSARSGRCLARCRCRSARSLVRWCSSTDRALPIATKPSARTSRFETLPGAWPIVGSRCCGTRSAPTDTPHGWRRSRTSRFARRRSTMRSWRRRCCERTIGSIPSASSFSVTASAAPWRPESRGGFIARRARHSGR